jgi:hypothetical protein
MVNIPQRENNYPFIEGWKLIIWDKTYTLEDFPDTHIPKELSEFWALWWMNRERWILNHFWVPKEFLPFALYHESICWFIDWTWNCVDSLGKELELVPENIKKDYIIWRTWFFSWMLEYAKNITGLDSSLFQQMQESLNYIKWLETWITWIEQEVKKNIDDKLN